MKFICFGVTLFCMIRFTSAVSNVITYIDRAIPCNSRVSIQMNATTSVLSLAYASAITDVPKGTNMSQGHVNVELDARQCSCRNPNGCIDRYIGSAAAR
jgi:hypothetical protein